LPLHFLAFAWVSQEMGKLNGDESALKTSGIRTARGALLKSAGQVVLPDMRQCRIRIGY
jgi:hypothetical protein